MVESFPGDSSDEAVFPWVVRKDTQTAAEYDCPVGESEMEMGTANNQLQKKT